MFLVLCQFLYENHAAISAKSIIIIYNKCYIHFSNVLSLCPIIKTKLGFIQKMEQKTNKLVVFVMLSLSQSLKRWS